MQQRIKDILEALAEGKPIISSGPLISQDDAKEILKEIKDLRNIIDEWEAEYYDRTGRN